MTAIQFEHARRADRRGSAIFRAAIWRATLRRGWSPSLHEWRRRAQDRAQLAALDDRMLPISASAAPRPQFLANKPFWKEYDRP